MKFRVLKICSAVLEETGWLLRPEWRDVFTWITNYCSLESRKNGEARSCILLKTAEIYVREYKWVLKWQVTGAFPICSHFVVDFCFNCFFFLVSHLLINKFINDFN